MAVKTKSERGPAGTLTVDDLTRAIKNSIDRTGMKEEEARAMAQHVLNFFGYSERIIDNVLEPEDRDAVYRERMGQGHPSVPEGERPVELLDGPQRLRPQLVREVGAVRVRGGDQSEGQSKVLRLVPREDRRVAVEGRPVEGMRVPLSGPARGLRFGEEARQGLLLDDEPGVQPAELERDPTVERTGPGHVGFQSRAPIKLCEAR